jgi:hypothetical protein
MSEGFSLIKIDGKISEPATILIQKISDAVGGYFKPYQVRRVAKAEAEAEIIKEQAQIKITNLHRRALIRFVTEEAKRQENIESITERAIQQLIDSSTPQDMEDDWIANFFDKCRIVSDEEMQILWAKILAGEASSPGTYSKRTINTLGSIDKSDANLFTSICSFSCHVPAILPLIYDEQAPIYTSHNLNFSNLTHLDDIGLVSFDPLTGFVLKMGIEEDSGKKEVSMKYYNTNIKLTFPSTKFDFNIGKVVLTRVGQELSNICTPSEIDGFIDFLIQKFKEQNITCSL